MKFNMFSIVVGNNSCLCKCPFCVSCEEITPNKQKYNTRNLNIAINLAKTSNIQTACITSYGEPLLFPDEITTVLEKIDGSIPFVELQTNGLLFAYEKERLNSYLSKWYELGLTHIALSTVHFDRKKNDEIYRKGKNDYPNLSSTVSFLHDKGFSVRLVCICFKDFIDNGEKAYEYIKFGKSLGAEQITLRPLNLEYRREDAAIFTKENCLSLNQEMDIENVLTEKGDILLTLPNIGKVYDVEGQNVMYSMHLDKNTRSRDPENTRNLIYFPDGHIRYEWEKTGGILL